MASQQTLSSRWSSTLLTPCELVLVLLIELNVNFIEEMGSRCGGRSHSTGTGTGISATLLLWSNAIVWTTLLNRLSLSTNLDGECKEFYRSQCLDSTGAAISCRTRSQSSESRGARTYCQCVETSQSCRRTTEQLFTHPTSVDYPIASLHTELIIIVTVFIADLIAVVFDKQLCWWTNREKRSDAVSRLLFQLFVLPIISINFSVVNREKERETQRQRERPWRLD